MYLNELVRYLPILADNNQSWVIHVSRNNKIITCMNGVTLV